MVTKRLLGQRHLHKKVNFLKSGCIATGTYLKINFNLSSKNKSHDHM